MSLAARARRMAVGAGQNARRIDPGLVYFNSFQGRYSDSPRAIAEELERTGAPLRQVWRTGAAGTEGLPARYDGVTGGTWDHVRALGSAGRVVVNGWMATHPKRRGQVWLQTWHGTPLKRIAFDALSGVDAEARRTMARDVAKWDHLISPNPFSTEVFRSAFGYEGSMLETGYPRNDVLSSPDADAVRTRVREALGLEPGRTAVLYAPTWRDRVVAEDDPAGVSLLLDHEQFSRELGQTHTLLLRLHHFIAGRFADVGGSGCLNVSSHPDISELYLAADVLVTDYSSAMFDFAVTGKPQVFLAPDLEEYRDRMRGFYFDFEAEAPGPIVADTAELIAHVAEPEAAAPHGPAYARFRERFCPFDDGHASRRVVEAVFGDAVA